MHKDPRGYFYRSRRVGDRVTRQYIGRGARCEGMVQLEALQRKEEAEQQREQREERGRLEALDGEVKAFCAQVTAIMRFVLQSKGYHQHARGQWRKQRMTQTIETDEDDLGKAQLDKVAPNTVQPGKNKPDSVDLSKADMAQSVASRLGLLLETVVTDAESQREFSRSWMSTEGRRM